MVFDITCTGTTLVIWFWRLHRYGRMRWSDGCHGCFNVEHRKRTDRVVDKRSVMFATPTYIYTKIFQIFWHD
ncbi:hypothetical protein Hanom_Chr03g00251821 [Helianthus anomalus]